MYYPIIRKSRKVPYPRKYPINESFFEKIDSEEKAYFLGLLFADGTNSIKKTEVKLALGEIDKHILSRLNNFFQPTKPLYFQKSKLGRQNLYKLIINSKKISYRLNDLGIVPNKTHKLIFPKYLDNNLLKHFIRGYFD